MQIDIIGSGRIALALVKHIMTQSYEPMITKVIIWTREKPALEDGHLVYRQNRICEDILRIHLLSYARSSSVMDKVFFRGFRSLNDISLSQEKNGVENLLILTPKFNLDELVYADKSLKEKMILANDRHLELLKARLRFYVFDTYLYEKLSGDALKKRISDDVQRILFKRGRLESLIHELDKKTSIGYERLYNFRNASIGTAAMAEVIRRNAFRGNVMNLINEVDTTSLLLARLTELPPDRIVSPCENDAIRSRYFIYSELNRMGYKVHDLKAEYIGPHNHLGFIPPEMISVNGTSLQELLGKRATEALLERVNSSVNAFGEKVFLLKGSSDEDTIIGLAKAVASWVGGFHGPWQSPALFRASCYHKELDLYTGLSGYYCKGTFNKLDALYGKLSVYSHERLNRGLHQQRIVNEKICDLFEHSLSENEEVV